MIDELRAKFRGRFISTAQGRVRKALQHVTGTGDPAVVRGELHSLAGEAAMLGFDEIASSARAGELAARRWRDQGDVQGQQECAAVLGVLGSQLEQLAALPG
ncbi:MAG: Hpt domain-containing protein [Kofleriaceae bacterium]